METDRLIQLHKSEISRIKKNKRYIQLLTSHRDELGDKDLAVFKLKLKEHEQKLKVLSAKRPATPAKRVVSTEPIRHPPNPAKARETERVKPTFENTNNHHVANISNVKSNVTQQNAMENELEWSDEYSF